MRVHLRVHLLCLLLLVAVVCARAAENDYKLLETKNYSILNRYELKNVSGNAVDKVKVKVYVGANTEAKPTDPPAPNDSVYQRKVRYRLSPRPSAMKTDALGNTYGEFDIGRIAPGGSVSIIVEKIVQNSGILFTQQALKKDDKFDDFLAIKGNKQYLEPSPHIESDNEAIKKAAAPYAALTDKPIAERAKLLFQTLNAYLTYDMNPLYAHKGALNALNTQRGVCTEFAGLYVALCRAMGIPARVVNGYWVRSREIPLNTTINVSEDRHAWAEFYLPSVGWVPVEPTIIYTVNGKRTYNLNYFAAIPVKDRHFIWGYGLEEESQTGISYSYSAVRDGNGDPIQGSLAEETVKLLPDDVPVVPPPAVP